MAWPGSLPRDRVLPKLTKLFKQSAAPVVLVVYAGPSDERGNWRLSGGPPGPGAGSAGPSMGPLGRSSLGPGAGGSGPSSPCGAGSGSWAVAAAAALGGGASTGGGTAFPGASGGSGSAAAAGVPSAVVSFREVSMLWQRHRKHSQRLVLLLDCANSGYWVSALRILSKAEQLELSLGVQAADCAAPAVQPWQLAYQPGIFLQLFLQANKWRREPRRNGGPQGAQQGPGQAQQPAASASASPPPAGAGNNGGNGNGANGREPWLPGMLPSFYATCLSDSLVDYAVPLRFFNCQAALAAVQGNPIEQMAAADAAADAAEDASLSAGGGGGGVVRASSVLAAAEAAARATRGPRGQGQGQGQAVPRSSDSLAEGSDLGQGDDSAHGAPSLPDGARRRFSSLADYFSPGPGTGPGGGPTSPGGPGSMRPPLAHPSQRAASMGATTNLLMHGGRTAPGAGAGPGAGGFGPGTSSGGGSGPMGALLGAVGPGGVQPNMSTPQAPVWGHLGMGVASAGCSEAGQRYPTMPGVEPQAGPSSSTPDPLYPHTSASGPRSDLPPNDSLSMARGLGLGLHATAGHTASAGPSFRSPPSGGDHSGPGGAHHGTAVRPVELEVGPDGALDSEADSPSGIEALSVQHSARSDTAAVAWGRRSTRADREGLLMVDERMGGVTSSFTEGPPGPGGFVNQLVGALTEVATERRLWGRRLPLGGDETMDTLMQDADLDRAASNASLPSFMLPRDLNPTSEPDPAAGGLSAATSILLTSANLPSLGGPPPPGGHGHPPSRSFTAGGAGAAAGPAVGVGAGGPVLSVRLSGGGLDPRQSVGTPRQVRFYLGRGGEAGLGVGASRLMMSSTIDRAAPGFGAVSSGAGSGIGGGGGGGLASMTPTSMSLLGESTEADVAAAAAALTAAAAAFAAAEAHAATLLGRSAAAGGGAGGSAGGAAAAGGDGGGLGLLDSAMALLLRQHLDGGAASPGGGGGRGGSGSGVNTPGGGGGMAVSVALGGRDLDSPLPSASPCLSPMASGTWDRRCYVRPPAAAAGSGSLLKQHVSIADSMDLDALGTPLPRRPGRFEMAGSESSSFVFGDDQERFDMLRILREQGLGGEDDEEEGGEEGGLQQAHGLALAAALQARLAAAAEGRGGGGGGEEGGEEEGGPYGGDEVEEGDWPEEPGGGEEGDGERGRGGGGAGAGEEDWGCALLTMGDAGPGSIAGMDMTSACSGLGLGLAGHGPGPAGPEVHMLSMEVPGLHGPASRGGSSGQAAVGAPQGAGTEQGQGLGGVSAAAAVGAGLEAPGEQEGAVVGEADVRLDVA
ncbi:hypothetical protein HYH03_016282 [Edaphochlamys debaryana]|uniref:Uncharacterized protein n=1 Tax=Edaphochlamys debaryana TaxID=47281 RepID=A0A836BRM4_9CHLO|nr:hypothetical protein HYH03_016282 [Edaphochlamys debaryana]|eukprot:KAG2484989.1 hypothetical protein HYH03_016282 [Edaphochlamys debaryana]